MNVLDWVLIAVFAITALWGYKTGLVSGVLNVIAIYVGLFLSGLFAGRVLSLFWDGVENEAVSTAIGYVIIFAAAFIVASIVANIIKKALKITLMGWVDGLGGLVVGLVAGVLVTGGVMTVAARYTYVIPEDTGEMTSGGIKDMVQQAAVGYAEEGAREQLDEWLTESQVVPSLIGLRSFVIEFAPDDFGVALDILEERIDEVDA
ncbi:MAG: CvpA family protein [Dehalococcoidia bacterium]|jgi:membrane protein required for colicin V production|nr:CvpA family protein [Dehalococcoidia bacterium]